MEDASLQGLQSNENVFSQFVNRHTMKVRSQTKLLNLKKKIVIERSEKLNTFNGNSSQGCQLLPNSKG